MGGNKMVGARSFGNAEQVAHGTDIAVMAKAPARCAVLKLFGRALCAKMIPGGKLALQLR